MACNPLHSAQTVTDGIHIAYAFEYANASARTGASVTVGDLGKFARQTDTNEIYMLTAVTPTWVLIGPTEAVGTVTWETLAPVLDGYATDAELSGLNQTVTEHYNQISSAVNSITKDLDGYMSDVGHAALNQLVHNIAESSYEEVTYSGGAVSGVVVYTDSGKLTKIREEQYTYISGKVNTVATIQYDAVGVEKERITETYVWSGSSVSSITRVLTVA